MSRKRNRNNREEKPHQQRHTVNEVQKANNIYISAKTDKQRDLLKALRDFEQIFVSGPAGTGKTYIATTFACQEFLYGRAKRIIITRPAIPACGEDLGFLPGSLGQKIAPWAVPVIEVIEMWLGRAQTQEAIRNGSIEIVPFGYLRGRTFRDCFILVDEAQNTSVEQMKLLLTRLGEGSKLVVSGDVKQSDIRGVSGLTVALALIHKNNIPAGIVEFTKEDVVRSELCKMWVSAFED